MAFGFFNKISPPAVESVQSLELRVSGMRGTQLYELTVQNGTAGTLCHALFGKAGRAGPSAAGDV